MMHIVMNGDSGVIAGFEVVIYSTMLHTRNVHWHILTMDCDLDDKHGRIKNFVGIDKNWAQWFKFLVKFMDTGSEITIHDMKEIYDKHLSMSPNNFSGFTPYAALRLCVDMIPEIPHCIYLDADVIVQEDVMYLYDQYLRKDANYAALSAPEACDGYGEMVSGVMVMNVERMRRNGTLMRARYIYNSGLHKYPDQRALELCDNGYIRLPETWDYIADHKLAQYTPNILHFTCDNKFKIYTTTKGQFYRYYPEHRHIDEGINRIKEVFVNYFGDFDQRTQDDEECSNVLHLRDTENIGIEQKIAPCCETDGDAGTPNTVPQENDSSEINEDM